MSVFAPALFQGPSLAKPETPKVRSTVNTEQFPESLQPVLRAFRIDFKPLTPPSPIRLLFATIVAMAGSLLADWLLARLTIIGVAIACAGWPLVTTLTSQPRRLFLQAAVAITIVLLAPDAYIWHNGASGKAVFVLIWMHVAIAIVTYNSLVHLAPVGRTRRRQRARHAR